MKILYAIQGTGNGHLSRARDIIPLLEKKGKLDILISGTQADVELPYPIKYKFKGLSFIFGKNGGIDFLETYKRSNLKNLYSEIKSLPLQEYDLIINDFEPVSAWACLMVKKECISLSHQAAVMHKNSPVPTKSDFFGRTILRNYAPVTNEYGFHFKAYASNIFTPVIRKQVREIIPIDLGHYTVYLPAYEDEKITKVLKDAGDVKWHIFSKHSKKSFSKKNFIVRPISNDAFVKSMASCSGVVCGAGFEAPAEALFLKKKLLVIPMKNQYEQSCNGAALEEMGIEVLKSLKRKYLPRIAEWIKTSKIIKVDYPDITGSIIDMIIEKHIDVSALHKTIDIESRKEKDYSVGHIISTKANYDANKTGGLWQ